MSGKAGLKPAPTCKIIMTGYSNHPDYTSGYRLRFRQRAERDPLQRGVVIHRGEGLGAGAALGGAEAEQNERGGIVWATGVADGQSLRSGPGGRRLPDDLLRRAGDFAQR